MNKSLMIKIASHQRTHISMCHLHKVKNYAKSCFNSKEEEDNEKHKIHNSNYFGEG